MARSRAPDILVRDARIDEAAAVADLIRELAEGEDVDSGVDAAQVLAYQAHPDSGVLVAELGGRPVGALTYFVRPGLFHGGSWGYVDELIVTASVRGRGIGDALLRAALQRFRAAGCREAAVSTMLDNDAAVALYRKHGFVDESLQLENHFD
jgi:ribosomal protein S18 acetylase RimI-like enzyme